MNENLTFNQNNINTFTYYILEDKELRDLVIKEDWKKLFNKIVSRGRGIYSAMEGFGFLYQYFLELDRINILKYKGKISSHQFTESDIKSIEIPDNIESIGYAGFLNCNNLQSVIIPVSVKYIRHYAFYHCNNLSDIYYQGTKAQWDSISKDKNWNNINNATIRCTDGDIKI